MSLEAIKSDLKNFSISNSQLEKEDIEKQIWKLYGRSGTVLILDMSGFSRTTVSNGLIFYLSMVQKMQQMVGPVLSKEGRLVKYDADNAFSFFSSVNSAIDSAIEINRVLQAYNNENSEEMDIEVSIGIDHGDFLYFSEANEFFGSPVNFACKLGEDIANAGEILVTENAWSLLEQNTYEGTVGAYQISGIAFKAYKVEY